MSTVLHDPIGPAWHDVAEPLDTNPSAPVPFRDDPKTAPRLPSPFDRTPPLHGRHVPEFFAEKLNKKKSAIYRMLNLGLIPGVGKLDPSKSKSHWYVADPDACVRQFRAERGEGRAA